MIRLEGVVKRLGGREVLRGLDLHVRRGEIFAVMGLSGSGKSVTLRHIVGLLRPDRGRVLVDGADLQRLRRRELAALRRRIGFLFQSAALINWMTVAENVALPLKEHTRLPPGEIRTQVEERLRWVRLVGEGEKMPAELSGGMRKRVGLARAIVLNPDILLYDEPTSGLDPVTARAIRELIAELNARLEATSVLVTHDLADAVETADRIGFLFTGRIVEVLRPMELPGARHPQVRRFLRAALPAVFESFEEGR